VRQSIAAGRRHGQRDPEIAEHRLPVVQQDVLGLDVAMEHPLPVRVIESPGDHGGDMNRLAHRKLSLARQAVPERLAAHERHDIVQEVPGDAGIVQW
jgi:hypothetical protein